MAISQPSYPVETNALVTHVGSYVDARETATVGTITAHVIDTSAAHAASAISFSATGTIAGTDVQTAVAEVATDAASALTTHIADETAVHGIPDTALVPLVNVFAVSWPTRPDATVVLWIGGDASSNDPSADMEVGDVWFPHSE